MFCVLIIPTDVYSVTAGTLDNGRQGNPDMLADIGLALQIIYYSLYGYLILAAFALIPFFYFYFEQEDDSGDASAQACSAFKYTLGFIFIFVVLLLCCILLKTDYRGADSEVVDILAQDFTIGDSILTFVIGALSCIGLGSFILYAGYGLAVLPASLVQSIDNTGGDDAYMRLPRRHQKTSGLILHTPNQIGLIKSYVRRLNHLAPESIK